MDLNPDVAALEPTLEERLVLGQAMLQSRQLDGALAEFQAALEKAPELSHVHLIVGQVHLRKHQYSDAERAFQRAAQLDPLSPYPLLALGRLHLYCGDLPKAEEEFCAVLAIDPRSDMALVGLGRIALQRGCLQEAESHLCDALAIVPDLVEARLPLAEVYRRNRRWDEAIAILQSVAQASAKQVALSLKLAEIYQDCHRYEALRDLLEQLRADYPFLIASPGPAQLDLITASFATGQASAAVDQLDAAADYRQLAVRQLRLKGAAHVRGGRDHKAIACFLSAWQWAQESSEISLSQQAPERSDAAAIHALAKEIPRQHWKLHHTPIVELASAQRVAFESRLVWTETTPLLQDPLTPELLESSRLSQPLGWWHIFLACRDAASLPETPSLVGFGLSEQQWRDSVLPEQLAVASGLFGVPSASLRPTISQRNLRRIAAEVPQCLDHLGTLSIGIAVTVDDHAQAASELSALPCIRTLRLPPDVWSCESHLQLWREQAQAYDWEMMAIGVETTQQVAALVERGCLWGMGPLYERQSS